METLAYRTLKPVHVQHMRASDPEAFKTFSSWAERFFSLDVLREITPLPGGYTRFTVYKHDEEGKKFLERTKMADGTMLSTGATASFDLIAPIPWKVEVAMRDALERIGMH